MCWSRVERRASPQLLAAGEQQLGPVMNEITSSWIRELESPAFAGPSDTAKRRVKREAESGGFKPRRASMESTLPSRSPDARERCMAAS